MSKTTVSTRHVEDSEGDRLLWERCQTGSGVRNSRFGIVTLSRIRRSNRVTFKFGISGRFFGQKTVPTDCTARYVASLRSPRVPARARDTSDPRDPLLQPGTRSRSSTSVLARYRSRSSGGLFSNMAQSNSIRAGVPQPASGLPPFPGSSVEERGPGPEGLVKREGRVPIQPRTKL